MMTVKIEMRAIARASYSADGSVVVGTGTDDQGFEAFRWENDAFTGLGNLSRSVGISTGADVSANGSIVVGSSEGVSGVEAYVWSRDTGMLSVQSILTAAGIDLTGWRLESAVEVSADGLTVVGNGTNPEGYEEAWLARLEISVTSSATLFCLSTLSGIVLLVGLVSVGIAGVYLWRRRLRRTLQ